MSSCSSRQLPGLKSVVLQCQGGEFGVFGCRHSGCVFVTMCFGSWNVELLKGHTVQFPGVVQFPGPLAFYSPQKRFLVQGFVSV